MLFFSQISQCVIHVLNPLQGGANDILYNWFIQFISQWSEKRLHRSNLDDIIYRILSRQIMNSSSGNKKTFVT